MKNKNHIFFDLDGTLIDSSIGIYEAYKQSLLISDFVKEPVSIKIFENRIGPPFEIMIKNLHPELDASNSLEVVKNFRKIYDSKLFLKYNLYNDIKYCLKELRRQNFFLYVLTNKRDLQAKIIVNKEFPNTFKDVYGKVGEDFNKGHILHNFRMNNNDCNIIFVGDTQGDFSASIDSGVDFIYASYGFGKINNDNKINICHQSKFLKEKILSYFKN